MSGRAILGYFLRRGTLGFGGPIALAGAMHRTPLVEREADLAAERHGDALFRAMIDATSEGEYSRKPEGERG